MYWPLITGPEVNWDADRHFPDEVWFIFYQVKKMHLSHCPPSAYMSIAVGFGATPTLLILPSLLLILLGTTVILVYICRYADMDQTCADRAKG